MQMSPEQDDVWADDVRDRMFVEHLTTLVTNWPSLELDALISEMRSRGFGRVYVDSHLQAITAAMMRARGEL